MEKASRTSSLALILTTCAALVLCQAAYAIDIVTNPFAGVTYTVRDNTVNILQIDLDQPGLSFRVTESNGGSPAGTDTDLETTLDYVTRTNAQIGINANFFDNSLAAQILGSTDIRGISSSNGDTYSPGNNTFSRYLNLSSTNVASVGTASDGVTPAGLDNAVAGFTLLTDNVVQGSQDNNGNDRTAIGMNATGDVLVMLVGSGLSNFDTGTLLKEFGATEGVMLDGGGSSGMVIDFGGGLGPEEVFDSDRRVGNNLAVFIPEPTTGMLVLAIGGVLAAARPRRSRW